MALLATTFIWIFHITTLNYSRILLFWQKVTKLTVKSFWLKAVEWVWAILLSCTLTAQKTCKIFASTIKTWNGIVKSWNADLIKTAKQQSLWKERARESLWGGGREKCSQQWRRKEFRSIKVTFFTFNVLLLIISRFIDSSVYVNSFTKNSVTAWSVLVLIIETQHSQFLDKQTRFSDRSQSDLVYIDFLSAVLTNLKEAINYD